MLFSWLLLLLLLLLHSFLPNGAGEYNEECWTRLYSDGMQKLKKDMELSARSGSEFTYRPSITQYFAEDAGPDGQIFDRLYKDAEQKKEDDALRQKEADEIFRKVHSFRPSISSEVEGRGEGVYQVCTHNATPMPFAPPHLFLHRAPSQPQPQPCHAPRT